MVLLLTLTAAAHRRPDTPSTNNPSADRHAIEEFSLGRQPDSRNLELDHPKREPGTGEEGYEADTEEHHDYGYELAACQVPSAAALG